MQSAKDFTMGAVAGGLIGFATGYLTAQSNVIFEDNFDNVNKYLSADGYPVWYVYMGNWQVFNGILTVTQAPPAGVIAIGTAVPQKSEYTYEHEFDMRFEATLGEQWGWCGYGFFAQNTSVNGYFLVQTSTSLDLRRDDPLSGFIVSRWTITSAINENHHYKLTTKTGMTSGTNIKVERDGILIGEATDTYSPLVGGYIGFVAGNIAYFDNLVIKEKKF